MGFFIEYYDKNGREILGSNAVKIVYLKTIQGVINRIYKNFKRLPLSVKSYKIYRFYDNNFFGEHKLVFQDDL